MACGRSQPTQKRVSAFRCTFTSLFGPLGRTGCLSRPCHVSRIFLFRKAQTFSMFSHPLLDDEGMLKEPQLYTDYNPNRGCQGREPRVQKKKTMPITVGRKRERKGNDFGLPHQKNLRTCKRNNVPNGRSDLITSTFRGIQSTLLRKKPRNE